jgi:uncharacterized protein YeaO (DUF488 family)
MESGVWRARGDECAKSLFMKKIKLQIRRVYEEPSPQDGTRVLVDRIWPRGLTKDKAHLDYWYKDVAPSAELRKWFAHKEERFQKFKEMYRDELAANDSEELQDLIRLVSAGPVTCCLPQRTRRTTMQWS